LQVVAENMQRMPEEQRAQIQQQEIEQITNTVIGRSYSEVLQEQIIFALVYNDYEFSQDKTSRGIFNDRMGEEFDRVEIPEMMKEFKVDNVAALKKFLEEQLGSSLEKEKRQWIREQIVKQWISMSMQKATGDSTHDEMRDFYERNKAMFTSANQARWQEMVVLFSNHDTEQEAWKKIRWMGNQVVGGAPFEEIAKLNSDGFTASNGGVWDWTTKGSLTSAELEAAVFLQPVGALSPAIIKSDKGLHIIRVLERQESTVVPLVEAQPMIREKIKNLRAQRYQDEYLTDLRRRYPTIVVKEQIDFDVKSY
jgi:parvulin-like peptidyl-prolyl isomerase